MHYLLKNIHIIGLLATFLITNNYFLSIHADEFVTDNNLMLELVTDGLDYPIGMDFLDNNDILIVEKKGIVERVVNGVISKTPALDIAKAVDNRHERGLLGIIVSGKNENNLNFLEKRNPDVYLYYSEKYLNSNNYDSCTTETTHNGSFCNQDQDNAINLVGNSLYKYTFQEGQLINPVLLLRFPSFENISFFHIGGKIAMGLDNRIYITSGDGNICRKVETCDGLIRYGGLNSQTANSKNGIFPIGYGGILYLDTRSDNSNLNSVLGTKYPLNLYYAYGIRNSFGIASDPITGNLWDTENGPAFGDEINLVEPGFNSGWTKKQGMWSIVEPGQIAVDPINGGKRGFNQTKNQNLEKDHLDDFVNFDKKGKYSNPEFTWNIPVGVTDIEFFNSDRYGKKYENDIFVGTFNDGLIYHFELDKDRKNLLLKGKLKDKIANNNNELSDVIFAKNLSSITDLKTGPDGYLYILSPTEGKIWRIIPLIS